MIKVLCVLHPLLGSICLNIRFIVLVYCVSFVFADSITVNWEGGGERTGGFEKGTAGV